MEELPVAPAIGEPAAPTYKDRSAGLLVFGILTLLLGCLCGLFIPLMLLGQVATARATGEPFHLAMIMPAVVMYGVLAVALVWLGIGSIGARRWARALILIFSWSWLAMGILLLIIMPFVLSRVLANAPSGASSGRPLPQGAIVGVMVVALLIIGVIFVVLPAVWVFFYGSRHVKATCERRDPVIRWTDACPLPVLGLCLWLAAGVPMILLIPFVAHGAIPCFGVFLSGVPGTIFCLLIAGIWAYAAWLAYRLKAAGWWLNMIAVTLYFVSSTVTLARHDPVEMYHLMGYPQSQIDQIRASGLMSGNFMVWMAGIWIVPIVAYLLFIKKYFKPRHESVGSL